MNFYFNQKNSRPTIETSKVYLYQMLNFMKGCLQNITLNLEKLLPYRNSFQVKLFEHPSVFT